MDYGRRELADAPRRRVRDRHAARRRRGVASSRCCRRTPCCATRRRAWQRPADAAHRRARAGAAVGRGLAAHLRSASRPQRPAPAATGAWARLAFWRGLAAFASVAAIGLAVLLASPGPVRAAGGRRPRAPPATAAGGAPGRRRSSPASAATARRSSPGRSRRSPLRPDRSLELWAIPTQAARRARSASCPAAAAPSPCAARCSPGADTLAVTVEPPGGSPTGEPTGPIVYAGKFSLADSAMPGSGAPSLPASDGDVARFAERARHGGAPPSGSGSGRSGRCGRSTACSRAQLVLQPEHARAVVERRRVQSGWSSRTPPPGHAERGGDVHQPRVVAGQAARRRRSARWRRAATCARRAHGRRPAPAAAISSQSAALAGRAEQRHRRAVGLVQRARERRVVRRPASAWPGRTRRRARTPSSAPALEARRVASARVERGVGRAAGAAVGAASKAGAGERAVERHHRRPARRVRQGAG